MEPYSYIAEKIRNVGHVTQPVGWFVMLPTFCMLSVASGLTLTYHRRTSVNPEPRVVTPAPTPTTLQGGAKVQPPTAVMPPGGPGPAPAPSPVRSDSPVLRRCRPASSLTVLGSLVVDVLLVMIPMTVGLISLLPQPARLALVLISLAALVLVVTNHALRGRSLGGALLGLRAVDIDAGLPPASLHSILAALRLGSAEDVVIVSTRRGPDPSQGTLADLERTPALSSSSIPTKPAPVRGPETAHSPSPSRSDGQYSASHTRRPAAAPVPTAERPVSVPVPPGAPTPTSTRPPSLPPSIPVQRPHPSAPGPSLSRAQQHTHPQQRSDTVEIQPIRAASPRPADLGDFPPSPPPPPAPPSQRVL